MKVLLLLASGVLFFLLPPLPAAEPTPLDARQTDELLARIAQSRQSSGPRQITFREIRTSPLFALPIAESGELFFAAPRSLRREIAQPSPSSTISNGQTLWMVYPEFQEVEIYDLARTPALADSLRALGEVLQGHQLEQFFKISALPLEKSWQLDLTARGRFRRTINSARLLLREDLSAQSIEMRFPDGSQTRLELDQERPFQPTAGFFEFSTPPGFRESRPLSSPQ